MGNVTIGGSNELIIQSMTTSKTHDVDATVKEIARLEEAGCQIVRVACPDERAANAISEIKKRINIPLVVDIHFDYRLALKAIEGGADKIRINPGNIGKREKVEAVVKAAKKKAFRSASVLMPAVWKDIYSINTAILPPMAWSKAPCII